MLEVILNNLGAGSIALLITQHSGAVGSDYPSCKMHHNFKISSGRKQ